MKHVLLALAVLLLICSTAAAYRQQEGDDALAAEQVAAGAVTAPEFSYLDVLTDDDLRQVLRERRVQVPSYATRAELLRDVIATEKAIEADTASRSSQQKITPSSGHSIKFLYCVS